MDELNKDIKLSEEENSSIKKYAIEGFFSGLGILGHGFIVSKEIKKSERNKIAWDYYKLNMENTTIPQAFEMADNFLEGGKIKGCKKSELKKELELMREYLYEFGSIEDYEKWKEGEIKSKNEK